MLETSARRAGHVGCVFYFFDFDSRVMFICFLFRVEVVVILANLMRFASSLFSLFLLDHVRGVSRSVGRESLGVRVVDVGVILVGHVR